MNDYCQSLPAGCLNVNNTTTTNTLGNQTVPCIEC